MWVQVLLSPQILDIMTIEEKVSAAILEKPIAVLEINGVHYPIAAPCISTLILASEIISTLPIVEPCKDKNEIFSSVMRTAKDFKKLGGLVAVLILGKKGLTEEREVEKIETVTRCHGLIRLKRKRKVKVTVDRKSELAELILDNVRPSVIEQVLIRRLNDLEIGDFFGITTSLSEINLLKPTKEVD